MSGGFVGTSWGSRISGATAANSIYLTPVIAQQNGTAVAVLLDGFNATASSNFRILVYDSAHNVLLAQSASITAATVAGYNRFPLSSPLTVTAGTTYYVGYVNSSPSLSVGVSSSGGTSWYVNGGQSVATPANPLVGGAVSANGLIIALELDGTGLGSVGFSPDQPSGVTLTSSNSVATFSTVANQTARSILGHTSPGGRYYAEVVVGGTINNGVGIGLAGGCCGTNQGTQSLYYSAFLLPTGNIQSPSTGLINIGLTYVSGDTIGICYDCVNSLLWFNKNNGSWFGASTSAGNPTTGANGLSIGNVNWPLLITVGTDTTGTAASFTLHDTAASLTYTPPSGYFVWTTTTTSVEATQVGVEEWTRADPPAQITQVAIEEWTSVAVALSAPRVLSASRAGIGSSVVQTLTTQFTQNVADVGAVGAAPQAGPPPVIVTPPSLVSIRHRLFFEEPDDEPGTAFLDRRFWSRPPTVIVSIPPLGPVNVLSGSRAGIGSVVAQPSPTGTFNVANVGVVPPPFVPVRYQSILSASRAGIGSASVQLQVTGSFNIADVGVVSGIVPGLPPFVPPPSVGLPFRRFKFFVFDEEDGEGWRPKKHFGIGAAAPPTSVQVTQVGVEEWTRANPYLQVTQIGIEEWTSVALALPPVSGLPFRRLRRPEEDQFAEGEMFWYPLSKRRPRAFVLPSPGLSKLRPYFAVSSA